MESSVLEPVQQRGREALQRLGLPTRRQEAWRLTDLKRLAALADLPLSASPAKAEQPAAATGVLRLRLDGLGDLLASCQDHVEPGSLLPRPVPNVENQRPSLLRGGQTR